MRGAKTPRPKTGVKERTGIAALAMVALAMYCTQLNARAESQFVLDKSQVSKDGLLDLIAEHAQKKARQAFTPPVAEIPEALKKLTQRQYHSIRFNPDAALWRNRAKFEIQLFHPGFLYVHPIKINVIDEYQVISQLAFDQQQFLYDASVLPDTDDEERLKALKTALADNAQYTLGFSGFRVHHPINRHSYKDEMLVFQGASYFRPLGPNQVYGISARGLAIDTGQPGGEEFPRFVEYWLIQPSAQDNELMVGALLDSPSLTGAFVFTIQIGVDTVIDVSSRLYTRENIDKLGVAPLTSMFFTGENNPRVFDPLHPEVHDSDGLQILSGTGEWIWRPLNNPANLSITSSMLAHTRGFGLAQRDRDFDHYQDSVAHYQKRPSLWVEPKNDWGPGRIELVEIPTANAANDNIVAYWVSDKPVKAGTNLAYDYRLTTFDRQLPLQSLAKVADTRVGKVVANGSYQAKQGATQFVVDFYGGGIEKLDLSLPVIAQLHTSHGQVSDVRVSKLVEKGRWRVAFRLTTESQAAVDMRLSLSLNGTTLSEVWNYVWAFENSQ